MLKGDIVDLVETIDGGCDLVGGADDHLQLGDGGLGLVNLFQFEYTGCEGVAFGVGGDLDVSNASLKAALAEVPVDSQLVETILRTHPQILWLDVALLVDSGPQFFLEAPI